MQKARSSNQVFPEANTNIFKSRYRRVRGNHRTKCVCIQKGRSTHTESKLSASKEVNQHGKTEDATQNTSEFGRRTHGIACKGNRARAPDRASVLTRIFLHATLICFGHLSIIFLIFILSRCHYCRYLYIILFYQLSRTPYSEDLKTVL